MNSKVAQLDAIVAQFDLNGHPFYQEWRAGTLPTSKLTDYSGEYGQFVALIANGWEPLGETHYAEEEREHERLWDDFRADIGFSTLSLRPQTDTMVTAARNLFSKRNQAIGALYAFEAQQPHTAQSKLDGLNEHYTVSDAGKKYFDVHASDFAEVELLKNVVASLSEVEFAEAKTACAVMCAAMWGGLDGVYYV